MLKLSDLSERITTMIIVIIDYPHVSKVFESLNWPTGPRQDSFL
jgi:hypothetical protein